MIFQNLVLATTTLSLIASQGSTTVYGFTQPTTIYGIGKNNRLVNKNIPSASGINRNVDAAIPKSVSFDSLSRFRSTSKTNRNGIYTYSTRKSSRLNSDTTNGEVDYTNLKPKVYKQRWVQLGYLSVLALLSDWICFSVAASPSTFEAAYAGHSAATLIDIFLFTNVASCFLVTDTVSKFGLDKAIKGASALMAVGCLLRSGLSFLNPVLSSLGLVAADTAASSGGLVPYEFIVAGTVMVGAAQPFFQCTPPMLSATWFASDERAKSTAIALNFNQIGIATAFLVGGGMATSVEGLSQYFSVMTLACIAATVGTFLQFQEKPPSPPSRYVLY